MNRNERSPTPGFGRVIVREENIYWQAAGDDVWELARIGRQLLGDPQAIEDGLESLTNHNTNGLSSWHKYLQQGFSI